MPLRYYGSVAYYAAMSRYGSVSIGAEALFDKRHKSAHRCVIADVNGPLQLTVPVTKPHGVAHARWSDVKLSDHGAWWNVHRVSLESAYGRTPFFEFYIDRFLPFLTPGVTERCRTVAELDVAIDKVIREILLIEGSVDTAGIAPAAAMPFEAGELPPYYQVRADRQGFMPGMSVLDLIFNLGPEAPLYLASLSDEAAL